MSAIIVIEIVIGLVVLAAAVRFAVRDTRERSGSSVDQEAESTPTAATPEPVAAPVQEQEAPQHLSEVASSETS